MSKKFSASFFLLALGWMMTFSITSSGGKSGKTGAPGENDCTQCHGGVVNTGVGSVNVSTGITGGYVPNSVYNMSVTVSQTGVSLFGFSIVALDANGASVGTFTAGTDNHTENLTIGANNRQYVTHNTNGGASADSHIFSFSWTAPATDLGDISFYVSANAANGNGGTSGDFIYTTTSTVSANLGGGGSAFVINEINPDPSEVGTDTTEFVELYGTPGLSLDGYVMVCFNGGTGTNNVAYGAYDLDGYSIPASGYFVIGNPSVANVNFVVPVPVAPAAFLQNGPDAIAIYQGNAIDWPNGTVATNVNLVDAVVYGTNDPDATVLIATLTPGQVQADESGGNVEACMARVPDGGTPLVTSTYVEQLPTPGGSNSNLPVQGCTDALACNFNPLATVSDASCLYLGFPCDDGNPVTSNDVITPECTCAGTQTMVTWTFSVDMTTTPVNPPGVYIAGTFQGWVPDQDLMTDANGDNVWEITVDSIPVNTPIEYKFLNGPGGWESSPGLVNCGVDDLFGAFNRADTTGVIDEVLPVVCFNSCDACVTTDIPGCTDASACNFNPNATVSDGSCILPSIWYLDADGDGFYVSDTVACSAPTSQYTATMGVFGDCNDADSAINFGGNEICGNGIDEDCSGSDSVCVVNGCTDPAACNFNPLATSNDGSCIIASLWYLDADADGYYVSDSLACSAPGAGYTSAVGIAGDCNDNSASVYPGAFEFCSNGTDENCDGVDDVCTGIPGCTDSLACNFDSLATSNNGSCISPIVWYLDADSDGFASDSVVSCIQPGAGYTATLLAINDCNDADSLINIAATEICGNDVDEDCSGSVEACAILGCTDSLACNFEPAATEDDSTCTYSIMWYADLDQDGFASDTLMGCSQPGPEFTDAVLPVTDCDDLNPGVSPVSFEICGNGVDENCDGVDEICIIEGCTDALACNYNPLATISDTSCFYSTTWYLDADADGYYAAVIDSCYSPGVGYSNIAGISGDCNDTLATINAGVAEICLDGVDNNCNGMVDENTGSTWYQDADSDGFGNSAVDSISCESPVGYVLDSLDCNDTTAFINPDGVEVCGNGLDEDCNGEDLACDIAGCTDLVACNYNPLAVISDTSCFYVGDSCDDGNAGTINDQVQNDCVCSGFNPECATNPIIISLDSLHNVTCFNGDDGFIGLNVTGGNTPYFANWNSFPIQTTPYASGLEAGTYTLTIEDAEGCIQTFTQEVTQPDGSLPVVSGNNDVDPADNEQYTVNVYPGCTYTWTVSNGLILSGQDSDTLNVLWNDAAMGTIYVYQTDTVTGCQWVDGLAVYINAVGISENIGAQGWILFPNPASDWITVQGLLYNAEIKLIDATGRVVDSILSNADTVRLNIGEFESGMYLVQVKDESGVRMERLIKQ